MQIAHRLAEVADLPFIHDSWLESFKLSHAAGPIRMSHYRGVYRDEIAAVMQRPDARAMVAYNSDDPTQVFGFICYERHTARGDVVHYVFVKNFCRRMGIATGLLRAAGIEPTDPFLYTYKTPASSKLAESWTGMRFDPLVARFPARAQ